MRPARDKTRPQIVKLIDEAKRRAIGSAKGGAK
jgi:hypothetical protein